MGANSYTENNLSYRHYAYMHVLRKMCHCTFWRKISQRPSLGFYLPPQLRTISSPQPPSLPITRHHLHLPPLSATPRTFHSKLKSHLFNLSYPDPSDHSPSPSQQHPP